MPVLNDIDLGSVLQLQLDGGSLTNLVSNHSGQTGNTTGWTAETGVTLATDTNQVRTRPNLTSYNPGFESAYTGTAGGSATVAQSTTWSERGFNSLKITPNGSNIASSAYIFGNATTGGQVLSRAGMDKGSTYTVSATLSVTQPQTGALDVRARMISVGVLTGGVNTWTFESEQAPNEIGVYRLSVTFEVPGDCQDLNIRLVNGSANAAQPVYWDVVLVEKGAQSGAFEDTLTGQYTGGRAIKLTYTASSYTDPHTGVLSPAFGVAPGDYVNFQVSVADEKPYTHSSRFLMCRMEVRALNGTGGLTGSATHTLSVPVQDDPWAMTTLEFRDLAAFIPSGSTQARVGLEFYDEDVFGDEFTINRRVWVSKLMVVKSTDPDAARDIPFTDDVAWRNIIGNSTSVKIDRGGDVSGVTDDIQVGTLFATVRDADLNPATHDALRKGKKIRVSAAKGGTFEPIFTGKIDNVAMSFSDLKTDPDAKPTISITATDAVAELSSVAMPYNYQGTYAQKVRTILAQTSVPFAADSGVVNYTATSVSENASGWDQILLARNSYPNAKAFVRKDGTLDVRTFTENEPDYNLIDARTYTLTNCVPNPSFEFNGSFGGNIGLTLTQWTGEQESGAYSLRIASSGASTTKWGLELTGQGITKAPSGSYVSAGFIFKSNQNIDLRIRLVYSISATTVASTTVAFTTGQIKTVGLRGIQVPFWAAGSTGGSYTVEVDFFLPGTTTYWSGTSVLGYADNAVAFNTGPVPYPSTVLPYWSGTDNGGTWLGTVDNSASTKPFLYRDQASYTDITPVFGSKNIVNELTVKRSNTDEAENEHVYGPYINAASRNDWGSSKAEVAIIDNDPSDVALDYLSKYSIATVFPDSLSFNALDADAWNIDLAWAELYSAIRVVNDRAQLDRLVYLIGITHEITPLGGWRVTLRFRPKDQQAAATVTNSSGTGLGPTDVVLPSSGPFASRAFTTALSIPNNALTTVDWDYNVRQQGGVTYDSGTKAITVAKTGRYQISAAISYKPGATSGRGELHIRVNGSGSRGLCYAQFGSFVSTQYLSLISAPIIRLTAGDALTVTTMQTSGVAQSLHQNAAWQWFIVTYLGP